RDKLVTGVQTCPSDLAPRLHADGSPGAPDDNHVLDRRRFFETRVNRGLELDFLAAPPPAVGRDDELRLGVVVAFRDGVGAEASEIGRASCRERVEVPG